MNDIPSKGQPWLAKNGRYPDDSVNVDGATVAFHDQGGGFQKSMPLAEFLQHFRPVHKDEMDPRYRLAFFAFDDGPTIYAWTTGHRWNGWGCPIIERSVLERFLKHDGEDCLFRFDGNKLYFNEADDPEQEPEEAFTIQHGGRTYEVFSTDNFGLCWNQYDPEHIDLDDEQTVHDCLHAISPPDITPTIPVKS